MDTMIILYGAYALIGIAAGLLGGLLGIGGGVVTVPCLYLIFKAYQIEMPGVVMHVAIGTSLAAMIFNTLAATYSHHQRKAVQWPLFKKMVLGLGLGSIVGPFMADVLSGVFLEIFFGIFLLVLAWYFWRQKPAGVSKHAMPSQKGLFFWSSGIGVLANLLGIAGGTLVVPFLTSVRVPERQAIGTAAATSLLVTVVGGIFYLFLGLGETSYPMNVGFINLPAFAVLAVTSFIAAPFGAKLTHSLPVDTVKRVFAIVLALTGILMLFR